MILLNQDRQRDAEETSKTGCCDMESMNLGLLCLLKRKRSGKIHDLVDAVMDTNSKGHGGRRSRFLALLAG